VSRAHYNGRDFTFETAQEIAEFERWVADLDGRRLQPLAGPVTTLTFRPAP
jgi:hypothetical protein